MTTHGNITDPLLIELLGALPAHGMRMIEKEAALAFELGFSEDLARNVWRSLFWRGHYLSVACSTVDMVRLLAVGLPTFEQARIVNRLETMRSDNTRSMDRTLDPVPGSVADSSVAAKLWGGDARLGAFLGAVLDEVRGSVSQKTARGPA